MLAKDEEDCDWDYHDRNLQHARKHHILKWSLITLTVLLILVTLIASFLPFSYITLDTGLQSSHLRTYAGLTVHHSPKHGPYITCEATSLLPTTPSNCTFDLLANGWIPSPCFDATMYNNRMSGQDFPFYENLNGTGLVRQATIMQGDLEMFPDGLWVTAAQHRAHCRYLVEGAVRATARPDAGVLDTFLNEGHMKHCFDVVVEDERPAEEILKNVKAFFQAHRCYVGRATAGEQILSQHGKL
ncbi:MAG: hypothetical protein Q9160_009130 [Pyrenula sp. 1 TL-2023]